MSSYTDWQHHIGSIENTSEKSILELGLGIGTEFLLKRFKEVYSFEVSRTDEWYKKPQNYIRIIPTGNISSSI